MPPSFQSRLVAKLASELAATSAQVSAAIALLDEGATVPFIARYRKEITGGLDDIQLRLLEERLRYLRELEQRRGAILDNIESQGKLTDELKAKIESADDKTTLEDLYLPYKQKRRTKAMIAREAGLEPLANALLANPLLDPEIEAQKYLRTDPLKPDEKDTVVPDVKAALEGAKQILMERFAEDAVLLARVRDYLIAHGVVESTVIEGQQEAWPNFRTTSITARPGKPFPRIARWQFFADAMKDFSLQNCCSIRKSAKRNQRGAAPSTPAKT